MNTGDCLCLKDFAVRGALLQCWISLMVAALQMTYALLSYRKRFARGNRNARAGRNGAWRRGRRRRCQGEPQIPRRAPACPHLEPSARTLSHDDLLLDVAKGKLTNMSKPNK